MKYVIYSFIQKWRPDTFSDVKGQEHIVRTLKNQIESDRVGHAYLFAGQEEQVRQLLPRYLQRQSTANILLTEVRVGNVPYVRRLLTVRHLM